MSTVVNNVELWLRRAKFSGENVLFFVVLFILSRIRLKFYFESSKEYLSKNHCASV